MKLCWRRQDRPILRERKGTSSLIVAMICTICAIASMGLSRGDSCDAQPYRYYALKRADPRPAPDFKLVNQDDKPVSLESLRGELLLITFGFTHCPNICPTILANLAAAYDQLSPEEQARIRVLFISVDPNRDSSKMLKTYTSFFNRHFIGLTGKPEQIAAVAGSYGVEYQIMSESGTATGSSYNIEHSDIVYIISPSGKWIGLYG